ncbi:ATP-dependent DNA helicase [methanogenic archaeon mixed culture ISO4-G1]|nr:ATP-dependent DNA helicase [methanogenic archaeon mixed culture ISO4-G1]
MMKGPDYSILISCNGITDIQSEIEQYLASGIKVFLFCNSVPQYFKGKYKQHMSCRLLQLYPNPTGSKLKIIDGAIGEQFNAFSKLAESVPDFNYEQYVIEHAPETNLIVRASAGTGKTSVMIDRIMYLVHKHRDLGLSCISMITFTNEATNQMNARLQKAIMDRYNIAVDTTAKIFYLNLLEEQADIKISTIDSFSLTLMKRIGVSRGFGHDISVQSHSYIQKEMGKKILDTESNPEKKVKQQLGLHLYEANETIVSFWNKLVQLGLSPKEIASLDWGITNDPNSTTLQEKMRSSIKKLEDDYESYKQHTDSIMMSESVRELNELLDNIHSNVSDLGLKYLFIDEFQDSNNAQINMAAKLVLLTGLSLFVVGDSKQSIYRFRGANESSFEVLKQKLDKLGIGQPTEYTLINNYRTSPAVINAIDPIFKKMSSGQLLEYTEKPTACHPIKGSFLALEVKSKQSDAKLYDILDKELHLSKGTNKKIAVLVRFNSQLDRVYKACCPPGKTPLPIMVKRNLGLYSTQAAKDFYHMISSFVFGRDPLTMYNYLIGPYSSLNEIIDLTELSSLNGDRTLLNATMDEKYVSKTNWDRYMKMFRYQPAISVIKKMLVDEDVVGNYIKLKKGEGEISESTLLIESNQYMANVSRIMEILQNQLSGDYTSLYEIFEYLKYAIVSNRDEKEAEIEDFDGDCIYCMTIHKAKGLEFDTVVIPYDTFVNLQPSTHLLISKDYKRVGWEFVKTKGSGKGDIEITEHLRNNYVDQIYNEDIQRSYEEESRLLYVAMTRAKEKLICFLTWADEERYSWYRILDEFKTTGPKGVRGCREKSIRTPVLRIFPNSRSITILNHYPRLQSPAV